MVSNIQVLIGLLSFAIVCFYVIYRLIKKCNDDFDRDWDRNVRQRPEKCSKCGNKKVRQTRKAECGIEKDKADQKT